jgi:hypothetical protein
MDKMTLSLTGSAKAWLGIRARGPSFTSNKVADSDALGGIVSCIVTSHLFLNGQIGGVCVWLVALATHASWVILTITVLHHAHSKVPILRALELLQLRGHAQVKPNIL